VVADANALIQDALWYARSSSSVLTSLADSGPIALLAPEHVEHEVQRHLPRAARDVGLDAAAAVAVWEQVHRPLLRFVRMPREETVDARVEVVARRDPDDVPVAQLAVLVAPCLVLTRDRDLLDAGIGEQQWVDALHLANRLAELELMLWGGVQSLHISTVLVGLGIRKVASLLARSDVALGLAAGAAAFAVVEFRDAMRERGAEVFARFGPGALRVLEGLADLIAQRAEAETVLRTRLVPPAGAPSAKNALARLLCERAEPRPAAQLHAELQLAGFSPPRTSVDVMLQSDPAFVSVRGRGWQLGELR
jgi:predicted nucleic acid-binding protein